MRLYIDIFISNLYILITYDKKIFVCISPYDQLRAHLRTPLRTPFANTFTSPSRKHMPPPHCVDGVPHRQRLRQLAVAQSKMVAGPKMVAYPLKD